ncbi:MAG: hypothetical protein Kow0069_00950 [Promethearchaeota archaeon]
MVECAHCGKPLTYLPFNCKYCGKSFCREHRLPENHECEGDFRKPVGEVYVPPEKPPTRLATPREMYGDADRVLKQAKRRERRVRRERERRIHRPRGSTRGWLRVAPADPTATSGAAVVVVLTLIVSLVPFLWGPFVYYVGVYIGALTDYLFHVVLTATFLSFSSGIFGLFWLFIVVLFTYNMGRTIELQFGRRFFVTLYLSGGILSAALYLVLQLVFSFEIPLILQVPTGCAAGAFFALITFTVTLNPEGRAQMLLMFLPVSMKAKYMLYLIFALSGGFGVVYLLMGLFGDPFYLIESALSFAPIGGMLAGYSAGKGFRGHRGPPRGQVLVRYI